MGTAIWAKYYAQKGTQNMIIKFKEKEIEMNFKHKKMLNTHKKKIFSLIRLAKTQNFNNALSWQGYRKTDPLIHC